MTTLQAELPHRKIWTREEFARLSDLFPGQRYELIEGDLIDKMGQKPPHAYLITLLNAIFSQRFPGLVRVQLPIALPEPEGLTSEPEPDLVVLHQNKSGTEFLRRHPGPQDIALLIEVADSSFQFDRETKGRLYARSGVEQYWIVDVSQRRVLVLQGPGDEYKSATIFEGDEKLSFGTFAVTVGDLLTEIPMNY